MFIEVHKYDGKPVLLNVNNVVSFSADPQLETKCVITTQNGVLYVQESYHDILDLLVQAVIE